MGHKVASPTWKLPVLEGILHLRALGSGITLAAGHHIAGKRETQGLGGAGTETPAATSAQQ